MKAKKNNKKIADVIVTGDVGSDIFIYIDELPSKTKSLREAWIKDYNQPTKSIPGCANAFLAVFKSFLS